MIPDYKKLDEIDVLICGKATPESDRAFTEYIKAQKAKQAHEKKPRLITTTPKKLTAKAEH
jgi:hypothetical protein